MSKKTFALETGAPEELELEWGKDYSNFVVRYQNQECARFSSNKELMSGQDVKITEDITLHFRLVSSLLSRELHILKDGIPLPGSPGSQESQLKESFWTLIVVSVLNVGLGIAVVLTQWEALRRAGLGLTSFILGIVLGSLTVLVLYRRYWAYLIAVGLFVLESAWGIYHVLNQGLNPNIGAILIRIMIVWTLWRGWVVSTQKLVR